MTRATKSFAAAAPPIGGRTSPYRVLILAAGALVGMSVQAQDIPATVQWDRRVELAIPVSGVVETVHVRSGAYVEKGAALVSLNPAPFKARLASTLLVPTCWKTSASSE